MAIRVCNLGQCLQLINDHIFSDPSIPIYLHAKSYLTFTSNHIKKACFTHLTDKIAKD